MTLDELRDHVNPEAKDIVDWDACPGLLEMVRKLVVCADELSILLRRTNPMVAIDRVAMSRARASAHRALVAAEGRWQAPRISETT